MMLKRLWEILFFKHGIRRVALTGFCLLTVIMVCAMPCRGIMSRPTIESRFPKIDSFEVSKIRQIRHENVQNPWIRFAIISNVFTEYLPKTDEYSAFKAITHSDGIFVSRKEITLFCRNSMIHDSDPEKPLDFYTFETGSSDPIRMGTRQEFIRYLLGNIDNGRYSLISEKIHGRIDSTKYISSGLRDDSGEVLPVILFTTTPTVELLSVLKKYNTSVQLTNDSKNIRFVVTPDKLYIKTNDGLHYLR